MGFRIGCADPTRAAAPRMGALPPYPRGIFKTKDKRAPPRSGPAMRCRTCRPAPPAMRTRYDCGPARYSPGRTHHRRSSIPRKRDGTVGEGPRIGRLGVGLRGCAKARLSLGIRCVCAGRDADTRHASQRRSTPECAPGPCARRSGFGRFGAVSSCGTGQIPVSKLVLWHENALISQCGVRDWKPRVT